MPPTRRATFIAFDRFGVAGSNSQGYDFAFATESACAM
ncbi:AscBF operon repressor [Klebsiella pneumoniae IS43]|uniref:AscBF operon repressor n=1 Tax=Klebsiella pneumoniae IS43 TaxID=1432552 RepID=W1DII8_KLEPN|nr:AscBF operon repressor [Klebsiella pneumoniae IS43]